MKINTAEISNIISQVKHCINNNIPEQIILLCGRYYHINVEEAYGDGGCGYKSGYGYDAVSICGDVIINTHSQTIVVGDIKIELLEDDMMFPGRLFIGHKHLRTSKLLRDDCDIEYLTKDDDYALFFNNTTKRYVAGCRDLSTTLALIHWGASSRKTLNMKRQVRANNFLIAINNNPHTKRHHKVIAKVLTPIFVKFGL